MAKAQSVSAERANLPAYFLIAFAVSWLFWMPLALSQLDVIAFEVPRAFFWLGGIGPITAATILTWRSLDLEGLHELYSRLFLWRVRWTWYAVALFWPSAIALTAIMAQWLLGIPTEISVAPATAIVASIVATTLLLVVEEVGWRGYALPRLQSRHSAFLSTVILGTLWGLWHFPLHLMPDYPRPLGHPFASIALFTAFSVLFSVVLTWIFNSTRGSLLLVLLGHQAFNTTNLRALSVEPSGPFMVTGFLTLVLAVVSLIAARGPETLSSRPKITVSDVHPGLDEPGG